MPPQSPYSHTALLEFGGEEAVGGRGGFCGEVFGIESECGVETFGPITFGGPAGRRLLIGRWDSGGELSFFRFLLRVFPWRFRGWRCLNPFRTIVSEADSLIRGLRTRLVGSLWF